MLCWTKVVKIHIVCPRLRNKTLDSRLVISWLIFSLQVCLSITIQWAQIQKPSSSCHYCKLNWCKGWGFFWTGKKTQIVNFQNFAWEWYSKHLGWCQGCKKNFPGVAQYPSTGHQWVVVFLDCSSEVSSSCLYRNQSFSFLLDKLRLTFRSTLKHTHTSTSHMHLRHETFNRRLVQLILYPSEKHWSALCCSNVKLSCSFHLTLHGFMLF